MAATSIHTNSGNCSNPTLYTSGESMGSSYRQASPINTNGLEVTESPRSVRVETDRPHLVSLGGGRLSTAITIHPLPEGRTDIGSSKSIKQQDIVVEGTGIEPDHCFIENKENVVILNPVAAMVSLDGMRITSPTRLSQGSMICLGRSTFFRFNHPQEAKLIKQILPGSRISVTPSAFSSVLDEIGYMDGLSESRVPMESSDFVEKVSKFEYLSHSRSPPVTSKDTQKWFVHEGLRIPSSTEGFEPHFREQDEVFNSYEASFLSPRNDRRTKSLGGSEGLTVSPRLRRLHTYQSKTPEPSSTRRSPIHFWSGRCTPTSPHLHGSFCSSEENLKACEDELKLQHRKARLERLKDEEQQRQEEIRSQEILNMCNQYGVPAGNIKDLKCTLYTSSNHTYPITNVDASLSETNALNRRVSEKTNSFYENNQQDEQLPWLTNSKIKETKLVAQNFSTMPKQNSQSKDYSTSMTIESLSLENNFYKDTGMHTCKEVNLLTAEEQRKLEHDRLEEVLNMCAEYDNPKAGKKSNHTPNLSSHSGLPYSQRLSHPYNQASFPHGSTVSQSRIKTNGSLPRDRISVSHSGAFVDNVEGALMMGNPKGSLQAASSEDELNEILVKENRSSPLQVENRTLNSPLIGMDTSSTNGLQDGNELYEDNIKDYMYNQRQLLVTAHIEIPPKELRKTVPLENSPKTEKENTEEFKKFTGMKEECVLKISGVKQSLSNIEAQESELLRELDMEIALVAGEEKEEQDLLLDDIKLLQSLQEDEKRLAENIEKECKEEQEQLNSAKQQLTEREKRITDFKEKLLKLKEVENKSEAVNELEEGYKREMELMEAEKKAFEDLEFQQLESEALREEEKESLMQAISDTPTIIQERKERLAELVAQQRFLSEQVDKEQKCFSAKKQQMTSIIQELQLMLDSLEMMTRKLPTAEDDLDIESSTDSSPRSVRSETIAKRQLRAVENSWRDTRDAGCQSYHSIDSESSSTLNSDYPADSLNSSSNDRSRPTSLQKEGSISVASKDSCPISSPNSDEASFEVRNHDHLLSLQDEQSLLDSKQKTTSEVVRRDKQKAQRPLTRYLPIRSQEFDLRQHIETAGHQIELCQFVRIDATSCKGYLHKLGGKWHTWKKRWFVFDRIKRALVYFSDKSETKVRGGVTFQAIEEVYVDHLHSVKSPHPQATLCMKTYDRIYYFMAPSPEAMRIWVDVIFTGAEGYLEFLAEGEQS